MYSRSLLFTLLALIFASTVQAQFRSFKFNNKYNHRIYTDAEGDVNADTIYFSLGCIGKWLCPSFKVENGSVVTVNGVRQYSKYSRRSFAQPVTYHVENEATGFSQDYVVAVDFLADHPTATNRVPSIYITTADGQMPDSREVYKDATLYIDGAGVFPDMEETSLQIRGRGNTSWDHRKKPYRIKFSSKQKPFGLTKGKNWVLLANAQHMSAFCNAIAMEIAGEVQADSYNHIVPCDLYINGNYRGLYNFTENPGFGNNSISLEDETHAVLLELDAYYDETYKFTDSYYYVCTNVKEPDLDEPDVQLNFSQIKNHYNNFCNTLKNGTDVQLQQKLDVVSVAKACFVTEMTRNTEVMHPKSWRLYNADITNPDSLYHFGPVWDFDWAFGYEGKYEYYRYYAYTDLFQNMGSQNYGYPYFKKLFRGFDSVKREYYRQFVRWRDNNQIEELCNFIDCYYNYVSASLVRSRSLYQDNTDYGSQVATAKSWLRYRASSLFSKAEVYDIGDIHDPITDNATQNAYVDIYDLNGRCLFRHVLRQAISSLHLAPGVYVVDHQLIRL